MTSKAPIRAGLTIAACMMVAGISACTSTQEIRTKPAAASYTSSKTILALEECLQNEFTQNHRAWGRGYSVRGEGRTTITFGHPLNSRFAIQLNDGPPSTVQIRVSKTYPKQAERSVKRCL